MAFLLFFNLRHNWTIFVKYSFEGEFEISKLFCAQKLEVSGCDWHNGTTVQLRSAVRILPTAIAMNYIPRKL